MYGAFEGAKSKMFLALISVGYTVKGSGSGGSYGYGKAGLIAGSSTRTVYAYSCFAPQEDDVVDGKPVTRRFLGMSYWGQHSVEVLPASPDSATTKGRGSSHLSMRLRTKWQND